MTGFRTLSLSPELLVSLDQAGYRQPTPIQAALIPQALTGRDVLGQAQTGTGKTASFLLPFFQNWHGEETVEPHSPLGIILAPTRELVVQVAEEALKLNPWPSLRTVPVYGGQGLGGQQIQLRRGAHLVVGTPGRVLDHLSRRTLSLDKVRYVVLDEADRMLDIGFRPDIERILRRCPSTRQTLLLSATMPQTVLHLAERYLTNPVHIDLTPATVTVDKIRQSFFSVDEAFKFQLLLRILERDEPRQCIIFCERKRWVEDLYRMLRVHRRRVAAMHGDLPQGMRNRIMKGFREGKIVYLVATDVVGRGIDVRNISHVINYDIPSDPENYVHRIGRTGRIGADGVGILFTTPEQGEQLTEIEKFINVQILEDHLPGFRSVARRPKAAVSKTAPAESKPVFGRRTKRYSNRV